MTDSNDTAEFDSIPVDHAFVCADCGHRWYYTVTATDVRTCRRRTHRLDRKQGYAGGHPVTESARSRPVRRGPVDRTAFGRRGVGRRPGRLRGCVPSPTRKRDAEASIDSSRVIRIAVPVSRHTRRTGPGSAVLTDSRPYEPFGFTWFPVARGLVRQFSGDASPVSYIRSYFPLALDLWSSRRVNFVLSHYVGFSLVPDGSIGQIGTLSEDLVRVRIL